MIDKLIYEKYDKIADTRFQGSGKTWDAIIYCANNNKFVIVLSNNHYQDYELYKEIIINRLNGQINVFAVPYTMFGKFYELKGYEQSFFDLPELLCPLYYSDRFLFDQLKLGNLPSDFCSKKCVHRHPNDCTWKQQKSDLFSKKKEDIHQIGLFPKQYIFTDVIDKIFDKYGEIPVIIDESITNLIFTQKDIYPNIIYKFKLVLDKILKFNINKKINIVLDDERNKDIQFLDFIKDFKTLIDVGINDVVNNNEKKESLKKKIIKNNLLNFLIKYSLGGIDRLNEFFKEIVFSDDRIKNIYRKPFFKRLNNLFATFYDIFEDVNKFYKEDKQEDLLKRIVIDDQKEIFTYIIDERYRFYNIFDKAKSIILTDSVQTKDILKTLFPEYNFNIIKDNIKPKFKEWNYLTTGTYPKYSLQNPKTRHFTKSFDKLVGKLTQIIIKHKNNKILIITFKGFYETEKNNGQKACIKKKLKEKFKSYNINIKDLDIEDDYFYNIEGKNCYKDREIVIIFGCPGIPMALRNALKEILGLSDEQINYIYTEQQIIQAVERLRTYLYPFKKIVYLLTKKQSKLFPKGTPFKKILDIEYKDLINYISLSGGLTEKEIKEKFFPKHSINNIRTQILEPLIKSGNLKSKKVKEFRGNDVWFYQNKNKCNLYK